MGFWDDVWARKGNIAKGFLAGGPLGAAIGGLGDQGKAAGATPQQMAMYEQYLKGVPGREVTSDFRKDQRALVTDLQKAASGQGPSLATERLRQGADQANVAQAGIANAARGSGAGLARFQAQNVSANVNAQAAQQAAQAQIAEQTAARNQLGLTLQGARGQDIESQLRAMGLNDEAIARAMSIFSATPGRASTGDALLAGATQFAGTALGGMGGGGIGAAAGGKGVGATPTYTPVGDNTMNPFGNSQYQMGNQTLNPFNPVVADNRRLA